MNSADPNNVVTVEDKQLLVNMVRQLLTERPSDPVPFIYSFMKETQQGVANPRGVTNNEVSQIKNLRKKVEFLKSQLKDDDEDEHTPTESDDEASEEEVKPKKGQNRKARGGVSAEVYGEHNRKGDFKAKVIQKSEQTKQKLRARLL